MTPERWCVVKRVFDGAAQQDASLRSAYLDRLCRDDLPLREEVEAMLVSDERVDDFMERSLAQLEPECPSNAGNGLPVIGSLLAHYRIVSELGSGGMAHVYLAEDTRLGRLVALKILAPEGCGSPRGQARFQREARLASALDHPSICTIYDVGQADGFSFIAMQYLDGETLKDILRGHPLSVDRLVSIGSQVADALAIAHARGIVHRDVKPSNVIVSAGGVAHVLDFGIAKLLEAPDGADSSPDASHSGDIFGTPAYLSPEQARGVQVDHRSDVFSLGALLYEMATGRVPFGGASAADTIAAILKEPHVSPSEINPDLPTLLVEVIDRALAKDVADRYQSVDALKADLRLVLSQPAAMSRGGAALEATLGEDCSQRQFRAAPRVLRFPRRNVVAAATVLALAGAMSAGIYGVIKAGEKNDGIAVLPFAHQKNAGDLEYVGDGIADGVIDRLSQLAATRVIARSTTFLYKDRPVDPRTLGRQLGVGSVVTGDVSRQHETVVIRIELVDVNTGARRWGNEYRRPMSALPAIPAEVALAISRELRMRLTAQQQRRLTKDYTRSTDAYQLYLKGRFFWNKRTAEGYTKAIEQFTAAATKDPSFALAYSGLADAYLTLRGYGIRPGGDIVPLARVAAQRALEIDDSIAEAYTSLGKIESDAYRWADADAAFTRAIALNPNYATAHHWFAMHLAQMGKLEEAMLEIRKAQALDPLSLIINTEVGRLLYLSRQYDAAVAQYSRTLELDPTFAMAYLHLGATLLQKGSYDDALAAYEKAAPVGGFMPVVGRARAHALAGRRRESEEILEELLQQSQRGFVPPYAMALLYTTLQDHERALDWLDRGVRDGGAWFLKANPPWDSLRSEPRFHAVVRRVGLEP